MVLIIKIFSNSAGFFEDTIINHLGKMDLLNRNCIFIKFLCIML